MQHVQNVKVFCYLLQSPTAGCDIHAVFVSHRVCTVHMHVLYAVMHNAHMRCTCLGTNI